MRNAHALGRRAVSSRSFKRYLFVGFSTVAIDYTILFILRKVFSGNLVVSVSVAYWTSIIYNFTLNRLWSFEASGGMIPKQAALYGGLLVFNYLVTLGIVSGLESMGLSEFIAKIIALCITVPWTYVFYKKVVFRVR